MEGKKIVYVEKVKPTEVVIEQQIIKAIYSEHQDIFRNKERFQVVLAKPTKGFHFQQFRGIYKGRFICGTDNCLQIKQNKDKKYGRKRKHSNHSNRSDEAPNYPSWLQWWKTQQSNLKPTIRYQNEQDSQIKSKKPTQKGIKTKTANSKNVSVLHKQTAKQENEEFENSRQSSSLSYVIFNFCSRPAPLKKLLEVYNSPKKVKIEIFIYVELMGQKCKKCVKSYEQGIQKVMPGFEYPFFGKTELKRMRKNFSSYIYNMIHEKEIKRYKPCKLMELQDHKDKLCEACTKGRCRIGLRRRKNSD